MLLNSEEPIENIEQIEILIKEIFGIEGFSLERILKQINYEEILLRQDNYYIDGTTKESYEVILLEAILNELKILSETIETEIKKLHISTNIYERLVTYSKINDNDNKIINRISTFKPTNLFEYSKKLNKIENLEIDISERLNFKKQKHS
ncbi:hypothetical protein PQ460_07920 [Paenibacillus sp. KACC 21273]|uniref:hypothetical protein n=1 Tax=Paenibacillus sp. KACC 21273 TaxID=3025665 RepID=UPI0023670032|nr:hypothetical protein [Paenibacillus sp. KACC 21273]WDF52324.1 hypothetical protein PQ460_07920 [Paenibacillus sp. KACC 21273]